MAKYNCDLCGKSFKQKIEFTRHKNKKTACVTVDKIKEIQHDNLIISDKKVKLTNLFKYCLDVLRNEHLVGDKALRSLAYILTFKLIEPKIGNEIDFDNYPNFDFDEYDDPQLMKEKLLFYVRFSNFAQREEIDLPLTTKYVWDTILSVHPKTKDIFEKGKGFEIKSQSTFKKLIMKINEFDFTDIDNDIQGEAYEEVIKDIMVGKILGQFFTPPEIKKLIINLINPQIKDDGTIETIYDPAMGTGGFLITALKHLIKQSKIKNIPLDWDFIINNKGIGGREAEPNTFQLAKVNTLISSGHILMNIDCGDSIRNPITDKYDIVLANPPYGIKGLSYDEINGNLRNEYVPVKINSAVPIFLQAIIYMLNINGRAAVVLPDGQDLFSKNKSQVAVREFLMKTCDLKEIIYFPAGIFTHTSIKTCVAYFIKKKEGKDIIKTKVKHSTKTKICKETERINKFTETHQTHKVEFYDYNPLNEVKTLLVEATIEQLYKNNYSLNYSEYLIDENQQTEEEQQETTNNGIVIKTLGEICKIENGKQLDRKKFIDGDIPVYGGGKKIVGYHNEHNREGNYIIVCGTGYPGYVNFSCERFWASQCFTYKTINEKILVNKYLYYYSKINLESKFMSLQKGTAQKFIRFNQIVDIKIPIPPIEKQNEIIEKLDFIYEHCIKTSEGKIKQLKQLNKYCIESYIENYPKEIKTLGEIIKKTGAGKTNSTSISNTGEYPFYGCTNIVPSGSHNSFDFDGDNYLLFAKGGGNSKNPISEHIGIGKFHLVHGKSAGNIAIFKFNIIENIKITYDYLNIILKHNLQSIQKLAIYCTGNGNINIPNMLNKIKIHIPPIEKQNEIVQYCESNDTLIKQLEIEIEQNKKLAKEIINSILLLETNINNTLNNDETNNDKINNDEINNDEINNDETNDK